MYEGCRIAYERDNYDINFFEIFNHYLAGKSILRRLLPSSSSVITIYAQLNIYL